MEPYRRILFTVTILLFSTALGHVKRYDGYKVLEAEVDTRLQVQRLRDVEKSVTGHENLDIVWLGRNKVHMTVSPHVLPNLTHFLKAAGIHFTVHKEDLQRSMDEVAEQIARRHSDWDSFNYDYDNFNDYETVMEELDKLAADCPDGFSCQVVDIGGTYENETIRQLRIGDGDRRAYWLDATMHAREWLATTTLMKITQQLIRQYGNDADATRLMDTYDFFITPVVNPDGYKFTWSEDRMWRKNRTPNDGSECFGTDLNRNFDYKWGEEGSSADPCSNTYRGVSPASELEVQSLQNLALQVGSSLETFVAYHTYGQMLIHSWAHLDDEDVNCARADDHDDLFRVASASTDAIEAVYGTTWEPGTWCEVLYESTGVTPDYVKAVAGVKYTYTPELRGDGFDPPPSEIEPAFVEMWAGLLAMVDALEALH